MLNDYDKIITSNPKSLAHSLSDIFNNKFLIYSLVRRTIIITYAQSLVGPLYFILMPLIQTIVYNFLLNSVFSISSNKVYSFVLIFIGTTFWNFFSSTTIKSGNSFLLNKRLITKVYFDRVIFFIQAILGSLINFVVNFCLLVTIIFCFIFFSPETEIFFSKKFFLMPLFILYSCCFSFFLGIIVASVSIRFRDLLYGFPFFFQLLLFTTPILYTLNDLSDLSYKIMIWNPFTCLLEIFRWFFYESYIIKSEVILINIFYFFLLMIIANFAYKKANYILSDQI